MTDTVDPAEYALRQPLPEFAKLPAHLAIIMDGNGRWAEERGMPRLEGHRRGARSVQIITRLCRRLGIRALTLYAFSEQNWGRPDEEVGGLMLLLHDYLRDERQEILDSEIRLLGAGRTDRLPAFVREPLQALCEETASAEGLALTLCLSYGGREELVGAARALAADVAAGRMRAEDLDEAALSARLQTAPLGPALGDSVDFVVRTSGERRLSNFLLWQSAYAELAFSPVLWPDFGADALFDVLADFASRERRFGLVLGHGTGVPEAPAC